MHRWPIFCTNMHRIVHMCQVNSLHVKVPCTFFSCTQRYSLWCIGPSVRTTCRNVQLCAQKNSFVQKCSQWEIGAKLHTIFCKTELDKYKTVEPVGHKSLVVTTNMP